MWLFLMLAGAGLAKTMPGIAQRFKYRLAIEN